MGIYGWMKRKWRCVFARAAADYYELRRVYPLYMGFVYMVSGLVMLYGLPVWAVYEVYIWLRKRRRIIIQSTFKALKRS